jgi:hypothetical protein
MYPVTLTRCILEWGQNFRFLSVLVSQWGISYWLSNLTPDWADPLSLWAPFCEDLPWFRWYSLNNEGPFSQE